MKKLLVALLSLALLGAAPADEELRSSALRWLGRVDAGDRGPVYNALTESVKKEKSRSELLNQLREARGRFGEARLHKVVELALGDGFALVRVQSTFEEGLQAQENVWLCEDSDGTWRISGYELIAQGTTITRFGSTPRP